MPNADSSIKMRVTGDILTVVTQESGRGLAARAPTRGAAEDHHIAKDRINEDGILQESLVHTLEIGALGIRGSHDQDLGDVGGHGHSPKLGKDHAPGVKVGTQRTGRGHVLVVGERIGHVLDLKKLEHLCSL